MLSVLRRAVAAAALVGATAVTAEAQGLGFGGIKVEEIRFDMFSFETSDFGSGFNLAFPATAGVGMYINDKVAIEPVIMFGSFTPDGGDATNTIMIGTQVPFYLAGDRGVSGLFVSPGVMITKIGDGDAVNTVGVEVGFKKKWRDNLSWRLGAAMWSTDGDSEIVLNAGLAMFVR
jgi:hypothetical protein